MISDEAVEAAADALKRRLAGVVDDDDQWEWKHDARAVLEAAAPYISERAYNVGHFEGMTGAPKNNPYRSQT